MQPDIHLNWLAIVAAVVAAMGIGFAWFGPLFGKIWAKEMGFPVDFKPKPSHMQKAMVLQVIGTLLTVYVMSYSVAVWRPSVWNAGTDASGLAYGCIGVMVWAGFYLPMRFGAVAWEMKSWKLFGINTAGDFVTLQVIAQILANWR